MCFFVFTGVNFETSGLVKIFRIYLLAFSETSVTISKLQSKKEVIQLGSLVFLHNTSYSIKLQNLISLHFYDHVCETLLSQIMSNKNCLWSSNLFLRGLSIVVETEQVTSCRHREANPTRINFHKSSLFVVERNLIK